MKIISVEAHKAGSVTHDEEDTDGYMVTVQIGPFVLEQWITKIRKHDKEQT